MFIVNRYCDTNLTPAQARFQWARLQLNYVFEIRDADSIRKRLQQLPDGLKDAYDDLWKTIEATAP